MSARLQIRSAGQRALRAAVAVPLACVLLGGAQRAVAQEARVTPLAQNAPAPASSDSADAAWVAGDHDLARRLYAARVAQDSSDVPALHRLALLKGWNNEFAESIALFDRLMRRAPDSAVHMERANVLAWSRNYERALADVDVLIREDSASIDAWKARARFLSWAGRYDASLAAYRTVDALEPGNLETAHARARVLSWAGRLDAAENAYRAILEQHPDDAEALRGLARVTSWRGELGAGEQLWRRAISAEPENVDARIGLSQVLRWRGQSRAALMEAEEAARLAPQNRDAQQQLAWAESAFAPRIAPSVSIEVDSDDNRLTTTALSLSGYLARRVALSANGYVRFADDARPGIDNLQSRALTLGARTDLGRGWMLGASGGVVDLDAIDADPVLTWGASVASPGWLPVTASVAFTHGVLDGTALLIERAVETNEVTTSFAAQLAPALRVEAGAAAARFTGTQDNDRFLGRLGLEVRATSWFRVRPRATAFWFENDLDEGYFDPDFYVLGELGLGLDRYTGPWGFSAELAPGAQQVGSAGELQGALSGRARVGYTIAPGREVGIGVTLSNLGIERFQADRAGYRYQAAVISAGWSFLPTAGRGPRTPPAFRVCACVRACKVPASPDRCKGGRRGRKAGGLGGRVAPQGPPRRLFRIATNNWHNPFSLIILAHCQGPARTPAARRHRA